MKKIVGGGLTGEQLYNFIGAAYILVNNDDDKSKEKNINELLFLDGFVPLKNLKMGYIDYYMRKSKEIDSLYNDTFKVYFNINNGHIVACHRGTFGNKKSWFSDKIALTIDIGNNFKPFTYRRLIAKNGHNALLDFFIECANIQENTENETNIRNTIKNYISKYNTDTEEQNIEEKIKHYFKKKLTTVGHSQGAIYAYLFGKDGKEIITYNPAPFPKTKPDNTYDVRIDRDTISRLSGLSFFKKDKATLNVLKTNIPNIKFKTYHGIDAIKDTGSLSCFFGDNTLDSLKEENKFLLNNANKCQIVLDEQDVANINVSENKQDFPVAELKKNDKLLIDDIFINIIENEEKKGGRKTRKKSSVSIPRDNILYLKTKNYIFKKYPKHSAYRSGLLVQEYKRRFSQKYGQKKNPYIGKKTKKVGLKRWFSEKWVNQRGDVGYKYKSDIYRPSVRITRKTPITYNELSRNDIKNARKTKYRKRRVNRF